MTGVYRVPLRRVYRAKHVKDDPTWDQVYGKIRCRNCRQHFKEGDPYLTHNDGGYSHVECPAKPKRKKAVDPVRVVNEFYKDAKKVKNGG